MNSRLGFFRGNLTVILSILVIASGLQFLAVKNPSSAFAAPTASELSLPAGLRGINDISVSADGSKLVIVSGSFSANPIVNKIHTSSDSGVSWVDTTPSTMLQTSQSLPTWVASSDSGQKVIIISYATGILHLSNDYGATWTSKDINSFKSSCNNTVGSLNHNNPTNPQVSGLEMSPDGSMIAIGIGYSSCLLLSTDSGANFSKVTLPTQMDKQGAIYLSQTGNAIWFAKSNSAGNPSVGGLWKLNTSNLTWSANYSATVGLPRGLTGSQDGTIVYTAGGSGWNTTASLNFAGVVYRSNDSGATFSALAGTSKNWLGIKASGDGTRLIGWDTSSNVWISEDSGASWTFQQNSGTYINSVKFSTDGSSAFMAMGYLNSATPATRVFRYSFPTPTTTTITTQNPSIVYGASNTLTATVSSNSATGTVFFKNGGASIGCDAATVIAGVATCTTWKANAGNYTNVTAVYSGNSSLGGSTSPPVSLEVTQAPLTITASSPTVTYGASAPNITASYSGLVNSDASTVVTGLSCTSLYTTTSPAGSLPVTSCSGGAAINYAISYVAGVVTINKKTPTFSAWADVSKAYENGPFILGTPSVTGSIAGSFIYTSATPSVISLVDNVATVAGAGSSAITATFTPTDSTNYNTATTNMTVTVAKVSPRFNWPSVSKTFGDGQFNMFPYVFRNLTGSFTYSSANTSVITMNGRTATITGVGTSEITATFTPDDVNNYILGTTTTMTVTVGKASPILETWTAVTKNFGDGTFTLTPPAVTGSLAGVFTYSSETPSVISLSGSSASVVGSGTSAITATFTPTNTANYNIAMTTMTATVGLGTQSSLAVSPTSVIYGSTLALTSTGGNGAGTNTFVVDSGPCVISGSILTPTGAGTCMVTATKAASGNYLAASSPSTAITVNPKGLTISGLAGVDKQFDRGLTGTATGTPLLVGVVGSDNVLLGGTPSFTFASANAANGTALTASGYTLTGTTAGNYTLTQPTVTANITAKAARVAATDTTVAFGVPVTSGFTTTGLISPDALASASYTYTGTGTSTPPSAVGVYTVTPSNAVLSTGSLGNYSIAYDTATVTILAKYTITYNANGGVIGASSTTTADFVVGDTALVLPSATREGFNFLGWFTLQSNGVQAVGAYTPTATITLWAHWIQKSLVGVGNSQKIGTITTLANVGNTYSATSTSGTVAVTYVANALPVGTVIDIYQMANSSRASSMISSANNYVLSLVIAWLTPTNTVPVLSSNEALTMVITDSAIKKGAKVYSLIGSESTLLGTATSDGSVTVRILEDPEVYIAITKPDAPTGVSATSGGNATTTVSWTAPSDGGSAITSYTATSNAGQTCSNATTSCSVAGLTNGTPYTFTVTATNAIGVSDPSAASAAATPGAPIVTPPSSEAGRSISVAQVPVSAVDNSAAIKAAKEIADKKAAEEAAALKIAAEAKAAEEAAALKAAQEKMAADAKALAEAKAAADAAAIKAAQDAADASAKAAAALQAAKDAEIAAANAAKAIKPAVTLYSLSSSLKLSAYDSAYLNKYVKSLKNGASVTCIGYSYSKNTTVKKATALAKSQATAVCALMKKANKTLKTSVVVYPETKAPKASTGAKWVGVSYRIDGFKN